MSNVTQSRQDLHRSLKSVKSRKSLDTIRTKRQRVLEQFDTLVPWPALKESFQEDIRLIDQRIEQFELEARRKRDLT